MDIKNLKYTLKIDADEKWRKKTVNIEKGQRVGDVAGYFLVDEARQRQRLDETCLK